MSYAGWGEVWKHVLALYGGEPIAFRIFLGLAVAFVALMILEGLRTSFLPTAKPKPRPIFEPAPKRALAAKFVGAEMRAAGPFRPHGKAYNPKRAKARISRHRPERPRIRRVPRDVYREAYEAYEEPVYAQPAPAFTEEAAPYTPLPPLEDGIEV